MTHIRVVCLFLLMVVGMGALAEAAEHTKEPLTKVKQNIIDEKAVLVDVREEKEWDSGHIDGATFLPLSSLRDGVTDDELKALPKDKILYLHCRSGQRCLVAGEILSKYGFNIRVLKPGYEDLISAGFPKAEE
ncbi:MAG: rhodanese-like domain-containing protein [Planctomycetaceae bacterium]